ncbi:TPA: hypothetical protein DF272_01475 [Candidatus Falkowbacteria bacterium]|nr:hypothetical protein [Candidatus Falkowbacteria bacterium]
MRELSIADRRLVGQMAENFRAEVERLQSAYAKAHQQIKPKKDFEAEARQLVLRQYIGDNLSQADFSFWTRQLRLEVKELDRLAKERLLAGARQHEQEIVHRLPDEDQAEYWHEQGRFR